MTARPALKKLHHFEPAATRLAKCRHVDKKKDELCPPKLNDTKEIDCVPQAVLLIEITKM